MTREDHHTGREPGSYEKNPHLPSAPLLDFKQRVQPLSRRLVPEPVLCVEVSPFISSCYFSTSRTRSSASIHQRVKFDVPTDSFGNWGSDHQEFCHQIHIGPGPFGSSCRWWAHCRTAPCLLFGLSLAGHQGLAWRSLRQVWLEGNAQCPRQGTHILVSKYCIIRGSFQPCVFWPLT